MRGDFEAYLNDSFRDDNGKLDLGQLLALEDEAEMDVAVIMPNTQPEPPNAELAEAIKGNPRALGCALIHPTETDPVSQVNQAADSWGMKGIKLMPAVHGYNVDNEIVRPVVEAARDNGLIVSIHSGPANCHPTRIGKVAGWIPETPGNNGSHGISGRSGCRHRSSKSQQEHILGYYYPPVPSTLGNRPGSSHP